MLLDNVRKVKWLREFVQFCTGFDMLICLVKGTKTGREAWG